MPVSDFFKRITGRASALSGAAVEKMNTAMDEYQKALVILRSLGFTVGKLQVDVGLLPAISTSVHGSVKAISADGVQKIIADNPDRQLLAQLLNALLTAKRLSEQFDLKTDAVVMDINLGVSPKIGVRFAD